MATATQKTAQAIGGGGVRGSRGRIFSQQQEPSLQVKFDKFSGKY